MNSQRGAEVNLFPCRWPIPMINGRRHATIKPSRSRKVNVPSSVGVVIGISAGHASHLAAGHNDASVAHFHPRATKFAIAFMVLHRRCDVISPEPARRDPEGLSVCA